jgi:hypothetical protein
MKTCAKCKEEKLFSEFYKDNQKSDGYRSYCKICIMTYTKNSENRIMDYRKDNKDKIAKRMAKYRDDNKDEIALQMSKYRIKNRGKLNAINAKWRAAKIQATPHWLTKEDLQEITEFYKEAQTLKLTTGQEYHVDHIVPLRGENVCGLHVPWNLQILSAYENISKSNKLIQE